ncbi:hypothetical protein ASE00_07345 [Sphingomonas sp. Root710]|nr:hypothetical protein ASE00_07345 [Sphingomonas sp. Root710]
MVNRFAIALDSRDWALHRTCFAETVTFDYPLAGGHRVLKATDLARTSPPFFECFDATQHIAANHHIEIDGDEALCVSTLHAQHFRADAEGGPLQKQIGVYRNRLKREGDDWKIFHTQQVVGWMEGNQAMYEAALAERRRKIGPAGGDA